MKTVLLKHHGDRLLIQELGEVQELRRLSRTYFKPVSPLVHHEVQRWEREFGDLRIHRPVIPVVRRPLGPWRVSKA